MTAATREARIVALGGGHGLYASLSALRRLSENLTAMVTVADDGGSSGRLRDELHVPPPGDLRMALSALCEDTEWGARGGTCSSTASPTDGPLDGHALGNLLIAGLWSRTGDVVEGLDWVAKLLRPTGRVFRSPTTARDQRLGRDRRRPRHRSRPGRGRDGAGTHRSCGSAPRPLGAAATLAAIREADIVALGPGSWYSSVLPHFLVAPVARARRGLSAVRPLPQHRARRRRDRGHREATTSSRSRRSRPVLSPPWSSSTRGTPTTRASRP